MNKIIILFSAIFFLGCNWGENKCPNCACDEGCCDSGVCSVENCACSCKN